MSYEYNASMRLVAPSSIESTGVFSHKINSKKMISLTKSKIPDFLRICELYCSLHDNEDGVEEKNVITIPSMYCKMDEFISSHADAMHLCHTLRYWGVSQKSSALMKAAFDDLIIDWNLITHEFGSELMFLQDLARIRKLEPKKYMDATIRVGWLELVIFLQNSRCRVDEHVSILAGECGHLDILEYFHRQGFSLTSKYTSVIEVAAKGGHLSCLQYAHEHGYSWSHYTTSSAAAGGHQDCLKYAHEHGCPWDRCTTHTAALYNYLQCLDYAHEHGCPWHDNTCSSAASGGHLDCLKYARAIFQYNL